MVIGLSDEERFIVRVDRGTKVGDYEWAFAAIYGNHGSAFGLLHTIEARITGLEIAIAASQGVFSAEKMNKLLLEAAENAARELIEYRHPVLSAGRPPISYKEIKSEDF